MKIYKTVLYKNSANVINPPANSGADLIDFETNFKNATTFANGMERSSNSVFIDQSYTDFKANITGIIKWSDIICIETNHVYTLYFQTELTGDVRTLWQKLADRGRAYSVSTNKFTLTLNAGVETPFLLFKNPVGSARLSKWGKIDYRMYTDETCAVLIRVYHAPTVTANGTQLNVAKEKMMGDNPVSEFYLEPTVSAKGMFRNSFVFSSAYPLPIDYDLAHIMTQGSVMYFTLEKVISNDVDISATIFFAEEDM